MSLSITLTQYIHDLKYRGLVSIEVCNGEYIGEEYSEVNVKVYSKLAHFYSDYALYKASLYKLEKAREELVLSIRLSSFINNCSQYKNIDKDILRRFIKLESKRRNKSEDEIVKYFRGINQISRLLFRCFDSSKTLSQGTWLSIYGNTIFNFHVIFKN